jgi:hypothetical protein
MKDKGLDLMSKDTDPPPSNFGRLGRIRKPGPSAFFRSSETAPNKGAGGNYCTGKTICLHDARGTIRMYFTWPAYRQTVPSQL